MTDRLTIFLPVPPSANDYWRHAARPGIREKTARNPQGWGAITLVTDEAEAYKATVASAWRRKFGLQHRPLAGDVRVTVIWCRARRQGDLPNRTKVLYDSLQKLAYEDDNQIASELTYRIDGHQPAGVLLIVEAMHADEAVAARALLDAELTAMAPVEAQRRISPAVEPAVEELLNAPAEKPLFVNHPKHKHCARMGQHRADDCGIVTKA